MNGAQPASPCAMRSVSVAFNADRKPQVRIRHADRLVAGEQVARGVILLVDGATGVDDERGDAQPIEACEHDASRDPG